MAGIAGIKGKANNLNLFKQMVGKIKHRGPDTLKTIAIKDFAGGVTASKLSRERGDGYFKSKNIVVMLDGEIYNKRNKGRSDAAVVFDLYKKYGKTFPGYLEGVFACCIYDGTELILTRDTVGVRPLYYGKNAEGGILFASELKSLVGLVDEVFELNPLTVFSSTSGINGYIPRYPECKIPANPEQAAKELKKILVKSVEKRLADGAVGGMLLSGGLDSSIIASIAAKIKPKLPAFTVGIKEFPAPDIENARLMADYLGIKHFIYEISIKEVEEMVPEAVNVLESFDEDCISGTISNLNASGLAAKHTNCILSGEGGDELFGGYHLIKKLPTEDQRLKMMHKLVAIAYNTALQRLDRSMFGRSINYRTPFIDSDVVAFALQTSVKWKIHKSGNAEIEKWILREAFKDMLPDKIYRRVKLRFAGGTGIDNVMDDVAKSKIGENEFTEETRNTEGGYYLNSPKELWYYKIFKKNFPSLAFEKLVGRWDLFK